MLPVNAISRTFATGAYRGAAASPASEPSAPVDVTGAAVDLAAPAPELPKMPDPVTPTTAAVYIMKVPSSQLMQAFAAVQFALGQEDRASGDADMHGGQAGLAGQLAQLAPDAKAGPSAGTRIDLTA
jgi:hypothetical protein